MRPPARVAGCSRQLHAVTWNSGVGAMNTGCAGASAAASGPAMSPAAAALASASAGRHRPEHEVQDVVDRPRWVSWAPLGKPVVPDV